MRHSLRLLAYAGAGLFVVLCAPIFLMFPVAAAETRSESTQWPDLGPASLLILALGVACLVGLLAGVRSAKQKNAWPHWRSLVLGCGEAAFLLAIIGSFSSMSHAFHTIAARGAAVTPADVADGYAAATDRLVMGSWVALVALISSGILALATRRRDAAEA